MNTGVCQLRFAGSQSSPFSDWIWRWCSPEECQSWFADIHIYGFSDFGESSLLLLGLTPILLPVVLISVWEMSHFYFISKF